MFRFLEGVKILSAHEIVTKESSIAADHDTIYAFGVDPAKLSKEEAEKLQDLGWFYDEGVESWQYLT